MVLIASMPEAPQGTITFVFTDIVGSTRLWEKFPADMGTAIRQHDALLREIFEASDGYVFKTVGDAFCVAFELPSSAVRAAVEVQRQLAATEWGALGALVVRAGVHSGPAEFRNKDYFGGTLNRAARIEAAAHGGQILVSGVTRDLLQDDPTESVGFRDLGAHRLRSLERPEQLFQILAEGLTPDFPAPKSSGFHSGRTLADMSLAENPCHESAFARAGRGGFSPGSSLGNSGHPQRRARWSRVCGPRGRV